MRNVYKILAGIPRRRWEGNVKMKLTSFGCEDVDWTQLAQDRVH